MRTTSSIAMTQIDMLASLRRHLIVGFCITGILIVAGGGWAATARIAAAVITSGDLVVDSNVKNIQHPSGGVVAEILSIDGDRVTAGQPLLRLDSTVPRANLAIVTKTLNELIARRARLISERDGRADIAFPQDFLDRADTADISDVIATEQKLFEARLMARRGRKSQFKERIGQLQEEIRGQTAQMEAKSRELNLIDRELAATRELWSRNLVPLSKLTSLEREATRIEGEKAQLLAAVAQSKGKIVETELQILQIDKDNDTEANNDLKEVQSKIAENIERKVAAEDQLNRIELRAPVSGIVHQSEVHTVGGVINAGQTVMVIVPENDNLVAEVKVRPQDIDHVRAGQIAKLRFAAFNQRTTPELTGTVRNVSADITTDKKSGQSSYITRIIVSRDEIARLGGAKLVPGMPVEVFIESGERTALSYLTKPLADQIRRAFREN